MRQSVVALCAAALIGAPVTVVAEGFTNADLLSWGARDRENWVFGAVLTTAQVVNLQDASKAACIQDWYLGAPSEARAVIFAAMERYGDWSPSATIVALMQRECGNPLID